MTATIIEKTSIRACEHKYIRELLGIIGCKNCSPPNHANVVGPYSLSLLIIILLYSKFL